jgi:TRAP-type C4-dicarboxylate transport system permease small subunit
MRRFVTGVLAVDKYLYATAGMVLASMVALTLFDVVLRNLGHPITGAMEIIQYAGSLVFGFSIPYATWLKAQIAVDLVTEKIKARSRAAAKILHGTTRCVGIALFFFIAYNFFLYGLDVRRTGELTASFKLPYYPFVFGIALSFLFQSATIACDLIRTAQGDLHE